MGANLRTFLLPETRLGAVADALDRWLAAKGFEPIDRPPPVWTQFLGGRGFALAENDRGVTVAYSDVWGEGERVLFELKRLSPIVLECWLHDSDIWGYTLIRDGETVAAFCSNPHYFGSMHGVENFGLPLPRNGDARLLTATLGMPEQEQALRELQVKKRVFAEVLTHEFADLIGYPALALDYRDWEELGAQDLQASPTEIAGHRVQSFVYVPKRAPDEPARDLHLLPARHRQIEESADDFDGEPFVMPESALWTIAVMRVVGPALGLAIRAAMLPIVLVARYWPSAFLRWTMRGIDRLGSSALYQELAKRAVARTPKELVREGATFTNAVFGVAIEPAEGVTVALEQMRHELFLLNVHGDVCTFSARDFAMAETLLADLPGEIREDLREFVDGLPLRIVVCRDERPIPPIPLPSSQATKDRPRRGRFDWFAGARREDVPSTPPEPPPPPLLFLGVVQEERFVYLLHARLTVAPEASAEALKATMRSLRRVRA